MSSSREISPTISTPVALERLVGSIALRRHASAKAHPKCCGELFAEKVITKRCRGVYEAAGHARGALYHHIGSKEELLYNSRSLHDVSRRSGEQITADMPDPVARIRLLSRNLMRDQCSSMTVCFREINSLTGERHAFVSSIRYQKFQSCDRRRC